MPWSKEQLAERVAMDLREGWYVNLGIGLPTAIVGRIPKDREVVLQSENGILGVTPLEGEPDDDLVHAGKSAVSISPGGSFFDSVTSFTMIRGGRLDAAVLGAYEVSATGDIASWRNESDSIAGRIGGVGGAADIAVGARRLWVMIRHVTADGRPKIARECRLPLTAKSVVDRVYSDCGILDVTGGPLRVRELAPGVSTDDLRKNTEAELDFSVLGTPQR
ncbi:MAG: CoA-transferase [Streptosporangiaceae bacterium]